MSVRMTTGRGSDRPCSPDTAQERAVERPLNRGLRGSSFMTMTCQCASLSFRHALGLGSLEYRLDLGRRRKINEKVNANSLFDIGT